MWTAYRRNVNRYGCLGVMSRQVVAGNPRYWGFAIESEMGAVVVVMIQEWREGISALI